MDFTSQNTSTKKSNSNLNKNTVISSMNVISKNTSTSESNATLSGNAALSSIEFTSTNASTRKSNVTLNHNSSKSGIKRTSDSDTDLLFRVSEKNKKNKIRCLDKDNKTLWRHGI